MREIRLNVPAQAAGDPARLGRLTRHLRARLLDFGPGGPEVLSADEAAGLVAVRFPGRESQAILRALDEQCGVSALPDGDHILFCLTQDTRFEDLDYIWGCLFEILS